jgi:hypothetical protein
MSTKKNILPSFFVFLLIIPLISQVPGTGVIMKVYSFIKACWNHCHPSYEKHYLHDIRLVQQRKQYCTNQGKFFIET